MPKTNVKAASITVPGVAGRDWTEDWNQWKSPKIRPNINKILPTTNSIEPKEKFLRK